MTTPTPAAPPDPSWDRAVLLALLDEWENQHHALFAGRLRRPVFRLTDDDGELGAWRPERREISMQRALLRGGSWVQVTDVLRHEMAHQYVSEALGVVGEPPHGPTFQRVCAERAIDARGAAAVELSEEAQRLLRRVERLLALAESSNPHEAELAATQAQALLTRHHLSLGGAALPEALAARAAALGARQLGAPKGRHFEYEYAVAAVLGAHFFVDCVWVSAFCARTLKRGQALEVCGRPEDIEIADYVYHFLTAQLDRSWAAHARQAGARGLRERLSFCLGVVRGFHGKLDAQRAALLAEGGAAGAGDASLALLAQSERAARDHLARRHPRLRLRGGSEWTPSAGYAAGLSEGRSLTLHKGVHAGPSGGAPLGLERER